MESFPLVGILALVTLLAVVIFAFRSKSRTEDEKGDPHHTKSTLASDAPDERHPNKPASQQARRS